MQEGDLVNLPLINQVIGKILDSGEHGQVYLGLTEKEANAYQNFCESGFKPSQATEEGSENRSFEHRIININSSEQEPSSGNALGDYLIIRRRNEADSVGLNPLIDIAVHSSVDTFYNDVVNLPWVANPSDLRLLNPDEARLLPDINTAEYTYRVVKLADAQLIDIANCSDPDIIDKWIQLQKGEIEANNPSTQTRDFTTGFLESIGKKFRIIKGTNSRNDNDLILTRFIFPRMMALTNSETQVFSVDSMVGYIGRLKVEGDVSMEIPHLAQSIIEQAAINQNPQNVTAYNNLLKIVFGDPNELIEMYPDAKTRLDLIVNSAKALEKISGNDPDTVQIVTDLTKLVLNSYLHEDFGLTTVDSSAVSRLLFSLPDKNAQNHYLIEFIRKGLPLYLDKMEAHTQPDIVTLINLLDIETAGLDIDSKLKLHRQLALIFGGNLRTTLKNNDINNISQLPLETRLFLARVAALEVPIDSGKLDMQIEPKRNQATSGFGGSASRGNLSKDTFDLRSIRGNYLILNTDTNPQDISVKQGNQTVIDKYLFDICVQQLEQLEINSNANNANFLENVEKILSNARFRIIPNQENKVLLSDMAREKVLLSIKNRTVLPEGSDMSALSGILNNLNHLGAKEDVTKIIHSLDQNINTKFLHASNHTTQIKYLNLTSSYRSLYEPSPLKKLAEIISVNLTSSQTLFPEKAQNLPDVLLSVDSDNFQGGTEVIDNSDLSAEIRKLLEKSGLENTNPISVWEEIFYLLASNEQSSTAGDNARNLFAQILFNKIPKPREKIDADPSKPVLKILYVTDVDRFKSKFPARLLQFLDVRERSQREGDLKNQEKAGGDNRSYSTVGTFSIDF